MLSTVVAGANERVENRCQRVQVEGGAVEEGVDDVGGCVGECGKGADRIAAGDVGQNGVRLVEQRHARADNRTCKPDEHTAQRRGGEISKRPDQPSFHTGTRGESLAMESLPHLDMHVVDRNRIAAVQQATGRRLRHSTQGVVHHRGRDVVGRADQ